MKKIHQPCIYIHTPPKRGVQVKIKYPKLLEVYVNIEL